MIDYNAFVRNQIENMPIRQFAKKIGCSELTVYRWRDGKPVSYAYRQKLDELKREQNCKFYAALSRDAEELMERTGL